MHISQMSNSQNSWEQTTTGQKIGGGGGEGKTSPRNILSLMSDRVTERKGKNKRLDHGNGEHRLQSKERENF